jgi:hypothetical protein
MADYERFSPKAESSKTLAEQKALTDAKNASASAIRGMLARVSRAAAGRY